jgi:double-stranded uracil-DNA glycosylase
MISLSCHAGFGAYSRRPEFFLRCDPGRRSTSEPGVTGTRRNRFCQDRLKLRQVKPRAVDKNVVPEKPTRAQLAAAVGRTIPDVIAPRLTVLFVGINPGLYSAATQHHFARPGNRFWPALFGGGFTPRVLRPWEERELLTLGIGITNVVARATTSAAELCAEEFVAGAKVLERKVRRFRPRAIAVLGVGAFRFAFGERDADLGQQPKGIGDTTVWVLPNPSGLNAHYQLKDLARLFREMRVAIEARRPTKSKPPSP